MGRNLSARANRLARVAGRIRDVDIALVRERSPIDSVIGDYVQLRNAGGGNLKGLCPFHDEKSPSFNVTPERGMFYCFGCSEGGDVISFVSKVEHLSFTEAVERLAQRAGIQLQYEQGGYVPKRGAARGPTRSCSGWATHPTNGRR
jgi:DNA primase